jgi:WD40 repeat protein
MEELRRLEHIHGFTAFSPEWRLVAGRGENTADSSEQSVCLWYVEDSMLFRRLEGHIHVVRDAAFSPDGRHLASCAGRDTLVRLWDVAEGHEIAQLDGHSGLLTLVAFSPDGRMVVAARISETGWEEKGVLLWDVQDGIERWCATDIGFDVHTLGFNPDATLLAIGGKSPGISLRDVANGHEVQRLERRGEGSFAFSPDWSILASVGDDDPCLVLWEVSGGAEVQRLERSRDFFSGIAFSPDGQFVASGGKYVQVWEVASGREIYRLEQERLARLVAFSPDGQMIALTYQDGSVRLLAMGNAEEREEAAASLQQQVAQQHERHAAGQCIECGAKLSWMDKLTRQVRCKNCRT